MLVSNVVPDYVFLEDVVALHPEPRLIDQEANAKQDKSDQEIQKLLSKLTNAFSAGINFFTSY
ncbi:hypothetical protein [Nostoc sp. CHAB 5715]|uniref:hypothetical protein n=1 Tax=Nostoc sp. CHAB 5715 TaxID=2780400 RepID=UPI001E5715E6|nr:hypothetical protein [Nostoc sp. CHAB 5715]MCC5620706.1 hypothetical protein [Nostoc sp. CHAB 5715]